jgi:dihydroorotate dehydrogenase (fumarate)
MADLSTTYAGLALENPIIVSSSGLVDSIEKIKKVAEFNPGAVVLKSLFEEQINLDSGRMLEDYAYPEAADYIRNYSRSHTVGDYLGLIENARRAVSMPVIASINCITGTDWVEFAKQIEGAGASALELNLFVLPVDGEEPERIEKSYFTIIQRVKEKTNLPLIVKISPYFSNMIYMVHQFHALGVKGVVMFNRLYEPDIDVDTLSIGSSEVFSSPVDLRQTLRWVSLVADKYRNIDISASTGVHDAASAIKLLLAGASTVQVCSVLYKNGPEYLKTIIDGVESWMRTQEFNKIEDFKGKLSYRMYKDPRTWERSQFLKYYSSRT